MLKTPEIACTEKILAACLNKALSISSEAIKEIKNENAVD
jgi:hypothetical protein